MTNVVLVGIGAAFVAGAIVFLVMRGRLSAELSPLRPDPERIRLEAELSFTKERMGELERQNAECATELSAAKQSVAEIMADNAAIRAKLDAELQKSQEKLDLLQSAREEMKDQFKLLASDLLEEKSAKFVEVNQQSITNLLKPFQADLVGLKERVDQVHLIDATDRAALKEQLRQVSQVTSNLHADTSNLTRALKGDAKVQGDFGEMILDQMLDSVGMVEGTNFTRQGSQYDDDGNRLIPDVVVHIPGGRHIVVDAKVSLTAYVDLVSADDDAHRAEALKRHIDSVFSHIKELSGKNYPQLYGLTSIDFVIMFVPNDGAFMQAIAGDQDIPTEAWKKDVLVVSPSTLLFALRTIAHLWRQEAQTKNSLEIARRGGQLYDKFVSFAKDLLGVGERLEQAREAHEVAIKRLSTGTGNLVRQAQKLASLGIKGTKAMPKELLGGAEDDDEDDVEGLHP